MDGRQSRYPETPSTFQRPYLHIYIYLLDCALFRLKKVYVGNILLDAVSLVLMAVFRNKIAVIILSAFCGVLYATLFTVPYILIAHYHATDVVNIQSSNYIFKVLICLSEFFDEEI